MWYHLIPLNKLKSSEISSCWLRSYLSGCSHLIGGSIADVLPLTYGVSQGSIVGPVLFLIFVMTFLVYCLMLTFCLTCR